MICKLSLAILLAFLGFQNVHAAKFYVAVDGNDNWSGKVDLPSADRSDGPFATPGHAVRAARMAASNHGNTITVNAGTYYLDAPVVFDARDSGLTFEAAPGAKVALFGGQPLTDWRAAGGGIWSVALPSNSMGKHSIQFLMVNGLMAPRSRLPASGFFNSQNVWNVPWMGTNTCGWKRPPDS